MLGEPTELDVKLKQNQNVNAEQKQVTLVDSAQHLQDGDVSTSAANTQSDVETRSVSMDFIDLPSNALLSMTTVSQAQYLVDTNPAFSNYKK